MKRALLVFFVLIVLTLPAALSADTGAGVVLGDPTGVSLLFDERIAVAAAWDVSQHLHLHADLWMFKRQLVDPVDWYMGLGARLQIYTEGSTSGPSWADGDTQDQGIGIGARVPFGLQWYPIERLEVFGELVPVLSVFPATDFDMDAGIGLRYHF